MLCVLRKSLLFYFYVHSLIKYFSYDKRGSGAVRVLGSRENSTTAVHVLLRHDFPLLSSYY